MEFRFAPDRVEASFGIVRLAEGLASLVSLVS